MYKLAHLQRWMCQLRLEIRTDECTQERKGKTIAQSNVQLLEPVIYTLLHHVNRIRDVSCVQELTPSHPTPMTKLQRLVGWLGCVCQQQTPQRK